MVVPGIPPDMETVPIDKGIDVRGHFGTAHALERREAGVFDPGVRGTAACAFIRAMGGEDRAFDNMDGIPIPEMR